MLIEEDEIEALALYGIDSIVATKDGSHLVALVSQEEDVWLEQVDLIVCP